MTLDHCLSVIDSNQPVSFIKCDVEQHELAVFQGAVDTLRKHKPVMLFESANLPNGASVYQAVFDLLGSIGYSGYFFGETSLIPVGDYDREKHFVREDSAQDYVFAHPDRVKQDSRSAATFPLIA